MKQIMKACAIAVTIGMALPVASVIADEPTQTSQKAEEKKVTFTIEKMTCAMCPITVRKAMEKVAGVLSVKTDYETKTAVVVFDPKKANVKAIAQASTDAGYPALLNDTKGS